MSVSTKSSPAPVHDAFYRTAVFYEEKGDFKNAETQLRKVLELFPEHVESRLLLAQIHIENEQLDEGLHELQEVARQVSPQNTDAQQRIADVWLKRASVCLAKSDLDGAIAAYSKAGCPDEVSRLEELRLRQDIADLAKQAKAHECNGRWQNACIAYRVLRKRDPTNSSWNKALVKAETEAELTQAYAKACEALNERNWSAAIESLVGIVRVRPGYRDSAAKLAEVTEKTRAGRPVDVNGVAPEKRWSRGAVVLSGPLILRWARNRDGGGSRARISIGLRTDPTVGGGKSGPA